MGVFVNDEACEGVLHHRAGDIARNRDAIALADAFDAVVGGDLYNDPERTANAGGGHGDVGLNIFEFHGSSRSGAEG